MTWWDNWLDSLCKTRTSPFLTDLQKCRDKNAEYLQTIELLQEQNRQLQLLVPQGTPPALGYIVEKDTAWVTAQLEAMKLNIERLVLDQRYYLTNQRTFLNIVAWDWVDTYEYQKERFDCENFAFLFKARIDWLFGLNQVGLILDYKAGHAYNMVLYPDGNAQILEPQNDALWVWSVRPNVYELEGAVVLI